MRKLIVLPWLLVLSAGILALFWYNEWRYSLPTPVPKNYIAVMPGQKLHLPSSLQFPNNQPVFLHFYNPDCPCSAFNLPQFQALVRNYDNRVNFAIVVLSHHYFTTEEIQKKFNLHIPICFDSSLAAICGVYSTPQAVIVNRNGELYYRGNYNRSRYCADEKTSFAQIALEGFIRHENNLIFDQLALKAYGCSLPNCKQ